MAEYIERAAAQKIICGWCGICQHPTVEDLEECEICPQFSLIPDADVRPVVLGKWEHFGSDVFRCSECGYGILPWNVGVNFCPNCGAEMREES